jgi:hypothetical protein
MLLQGILILTILSENGEGSGKKKKKYTRMEKCSSVFPTAAPSRRVPDRVVLHAMYIQFQIYAIPYCLTDISFAGPLI